MLRIPITQQTRLLSPYLLSAGVDRTVNMWKSVVKSPGLFFSQFHTPICRTTAYQGTCQKQGKNLAWIKSYKLHQKHTNLHRSTSTCAENNLMKQEEKVLEFKPIYRLPSIVSLRILSRVKIAQTGLTLALIPLLTHFHALGIVTTWQLQFSIATASFALFMLYVMSFYLRRVIGVMYVHRNGDLLKVSHLTFWGNRMDFVFPIVDVIPLSEGSNKPDEILIKLERYSTKDVLYFTLQFGYIMDVEQFESVFGRP